MWPLSSLLAPPACQSKSPQPIRRFCPFASRLIRPPAANASIQHVGNVRVPHVCARGPRPPAAPQQRSGGRLLPGDGGHSPDTLHGEARSRDRQRDGRFGSGDPPGAAPAAESGEGALHVYTGTRRVVPTHCCLSSPRPRDMFAFI